jgi:ribonucleoside-diphosphate reductase alpha chain
MRLGIFDDEVIQDIQASGQIGKVSRIPQNIKAIYKTALEIHPDDHLLMASVVQKAVDESISKTVNIPADSTRVDIFNIYLQAYQLGLKGISVFRTGSRTFQPRKLANL